MSTMAARTVANNMSKCRDKFKMAKEKQSKLKHLWIILWVRCQLSKKHLWEEACIPWIRLNCNIM